MLEAEFWVTELSARISMANLFGSSHATCHFVRLYGA